MPASLRVGDRSFAEEELIALGRESARTIDPAMRLFAHAADPVAFGIVLFAAADLGCTILAAPSYWEPERVRELAPRYGAHGRLHERDGKIALDLWHPPSNPGTAPSSSEPGLVIFTSGTTGIPKAVGHGWDGIAASAGFVSERLRGRTWYLTYEPAGYAGLQVFYSALRSGGTLVFPHRQLDFAAHARAIVEQGVQVVSATPTWWRLLLGAWPRELAVPRLHQISMGGEVVDQATLDLVDRTFRPEHLTHIYATSEVGSAIVVSDRRAGFPEAALGEGRRVQLRIENGVLEVRSPFRMQRYLDLEGPGAGDWIRTGDRVEMRDGRCYFTGREDRRINVGGTKVAPEEVESAVLEDPEVRDCLAYGKASPITGSLLAIDVVPAQGDALDKKALKQRLRARMPAHMVPQHIRVVERIQVSESGKKQR